jgi:hypothetical protein
VNPFSLYPQWGVAWHVHEQPGHKALILNPREVNVAFGLPLIEREKIVNKHKHYFTYGDEQTNLLW